MRSLSLCIAFSLLSCGPADAPAAVQSAAPPAENAVSISAGASYDFESPSASVDLPEALREISGVTVLPDGRLAAVQDEAGVLFILDAESGAVLSEQPFAGPGDYEDVAHAAGAVWVLEANGTLFEIPESGTAREHETPLKKKCDAEGLAFDSARSRLLIACKEDPGEGFDEDEHRAVYAFDLATGSLLEEPVFLLQRSELDSDDNFKPSAIGVHPLTGEIYVMSSVRRAIAILAPDGRLARVVDLPAGRNAQPEGMAFLPDGTLFISNEGPDAPATLQRFAPAR